MGNAPGNPPVPHRALRALGAYTFLPLFGLLAACNANKGSAISFAFDRPEYVETVCIDRISDRELPMRCCSPNVDDAPVAPADSPYTLPPVNSSLRIPCQSSNGLPVEAALHALVTQSVRGEVAAVDLPRRKVLDSDQRIPGFTFLDVGGQPVAVVAPPERPTPGFEPTSPKGPPWTYVASAADQAIRAVATCRFRTGIPCGPERPNGPEGAPIEANKVELFLQGEPHDMLLGPDEALWVSLPEQGLLARVRLAPEMGDAGTPDAGDAGTPDAGDAGTPDDMVDPFLYEDGENVDPQYYRVPTPGSFALGQPRDDAPYAAICGLGHDFVPGTTELPLAPRAPGEGAPAPTRMRYDAQSGLLFVADQNLPVLHVYALAADGTLTALGAAPTGEPMSDFALTPALPVDAPSLFTHDPLYSSADTKRYLYGLDPRGGLMAFELVASASGATLTPLKASLPDLYQDRLQLVSRNSIGVALEVVDTRPNDPNNCANGIDVIPQYDGKKLTGVTSAPKSFSPNESRSIASLMQSEADEGNRTYDRAVETNNAEIIAQATVVRNQAQRYFEIARDAGPSQLRGVFLFVISMAGELTAFDLLDLDVQCRAQTSCSSKGANDKSGVFETYPMLEGNAVQSGTSPLSLAVQRNAPRMLTAQEALTSVSNTEAFAALPLSEEVPPAPICGPMYTAADRDDALQPLCLIADPWAERDQNWSAQVDLPVPGLTISGGVLTQLSEERVAIQVPAGISLCGRGAQDGVGDVVAILGGAPANLKNDKNCQVPATGNEIRLKIEEAYDDHLVLRALGLTQNVDEAEAELTDEDDQRFDIGDVERRRQARRAEVDSLVSCYSEYISFEVRSGSELNREPCVPDMDGNCPSYAPPLRDNEKVSISKVYLVTGAVSGYLHRMISGADKRCVEDPKKDPRFRARTLQGELFENPQISFTLTPAASTAVSLVLTQGSNYERQGITSADLASARPTALRWFPYTEDLFMVDSATQGLRRFTLSPFQTDPDAVYR